MSRAEGDAAGGQTGFAIDTATLKRVRAILLHELSGTRELVQRERCGTPGEPMERRKSARLYRAAA
jgi:hypothetical protein